MELRPEVGEVVTHLGETAANWDRFVPPCTQVGVTPENPPLATDYRQLWGSVTTNEAKAIRTLAEILAEKEGRRFISHLDSEAAGLCIEILVHVSHDPELFISPPQAVSSGYRREQPHIHRETHFLHHIEETCRISWEIAKFHANSERD